MNKTIAFTHYTDDNREVEITLPAKWEVCDRCEGTGKHVNPAIDGNGLSQEDFDQDPDFREDYFNGVYDVRCEECRGERLVLEVDEARADPNDLKLWHDKQQADADYRAECEMERKYGA